MCQTGVLQGHNLVDHKGEGSGVSRQKAKKFFHHEGTKELQRGQGAGGKVNEIGCVCFLCAFVVKKVPL